YDLASGALTELLLAPGGQPLWKRLAANARGQNTQVWYGNGAITSEHYDPYTGMQTASQAGPSAAPAAITDRAYRYDSLDRLILRHDRLQSTAETFRYDPLNRLTGMVLNNTASAQLLRNVSHQYDALGNMVFNSE